MLKCWTREPHKRPSFQHIESCLEHLKSSSQGNQNALVYYNDDYRNSDISQGIVNQAFEGYPRGEDHDTETPGSFLRDCHHCTPEDSDLIVTSGSTWHNYTQMIEEDDMLNRWKNLVIHELQK
ncbi:hypothetical protein scyTo_0008574 [Scyliorhinus torazame]|uniref:Uncharacterized protein n=1 Tax=Scyliorhinus torazame TaxID=75743 RepID=A0A401PBB5_SCYTO|nr:hypothetical protein [Scyliorhinus torazame]